MSFIKKPFKLVSVRYSVKDCNPLSGHESRPTSNRVEFRKEFFTEGGLQRRIAKYEGKGLVIAHGCPEGNTHYVLLNAINGRGLCKVPSLMFEESQDTFSINESNIPRFGSPELFIFDIDALVGQEHKGLKNIRELFDYLLEDGKEIAITGEVNTWSLYDHAKRYGEQLNIVGGKGLVPIDMVLKSCGNSGEEEVVQPFNAVYVCDTDEGIQAAKKAGVHSVGLYDEISEVDIRAAKPEFAFSSLEQVAYLEPRRMDGRGLECVPPVEIRGPLGSNSPRAKFDKDLAQTMANQRTTQGTSDYVEPSRHFLGD